ncbi:MAG: GAF domain-containing protein [Anaerolineales bacterium]
MTTKDSHIPKQGQQPTPGDDRAGSFNLDPDSLIVEGDRAYQTYDHEAALQAYSQALDWDPPGALTGDQRFHVLSRRAETHRALGDFAGMQTDCLEMVRIARREDSLKMLAEAVFRIAETGQPFDGWQEVLKLAKQTAKRAQKAGDPALQAKALTALGILYVFDHDNTKAEQVWRDALPLFPQGEEHWAHAACLVNLGRLPGEQQAEQGKPLIDQALEIVRRHGDRRLEPLVLLLESSFAMDAAAKRRSAEQSLAIAVDLELGEATAQGHNYLALIYLHLGLYDAALHDIQRSIALGRSGLGHALLSASLETEARIYVEQRHFDSARASFEESLTLAQALNNRNFEAYNLLGLGRLAFIQGNTAEAIAKIRRAIAIFEERDEKPEIGYALASLAEVQLQDGPWKDAFRSASQATATISAAKEPNQDFPPQDVWWTYYQVLQARPKRRKYLDPTDHSKGTLEEAAERSLIQAFQLARVNIETTSDHGLKRSYWNKVEVNRRILEEVARQDLEVDWESISGEAQEPGDLQEQLQRMLDVGVRMNEIRDPDELVGFVMDELVELSGAEFAALILEDEDANRRCPAARGFESNQDPLSIAAPLIEDASRTSRAVLRQRVSEQDPSQTTDDLFQSLSALVVPMVAHGSAHGYLYAANHTLFGPFNKGDLSLVSAFANQVAAALDNADLYQDLEQRVADRTAELERANAALLDRTAELSIINSVQNGLAAKLDMQAIYDLVGNQVRDIFDAQVVHIRIYDPDTDTLTFPFTLDRNRRLEVPPMKMQGVGISGEIIRSRQPLLINRDFKRHAEDLGSFLLEGQEEWPKSALGCPIMAGAQVTGIVLVENFDREDAFSQNDVDLLSTLTASMSVALENAQLFAETNRLLQETEQRAAELQIINSVQRGLASRLDMQSIYQLVGDRLREIFDVETVMIAFRDEKENRVVNAYYNDQGQVTEGWSRPYGQGRLFESIVDTGQPVNLTSPEGSDNISTIPVASPGTDEDLNRSLLAVPIFREGKVIGITSVQSYQVNAFDENDLTLLQALTNSMSIALENARLLDETNRLLEETQQRATELGIINNVGQALVKKLDFESILELIGDRVRTIFEADTMFILLYDPETTIARMGYYIDRDKRHWPVPVAGGRGLSKLILQTEEPLLLNTKQESTELGSFHIADEGEEDLNESFLGVPFFSGDHIGGILSVQSYEQFAYDEGDLRLLTTLASSMSVALENARLFEETNRLLEETRERATELGIINNVGQALVKKMEFDAILELVGQRLKDIFDADTTYIMLYEPENQIVNTAYYFDGGQRIQLQPQKLGTSLNKVMVDSREPLLLGTMDEAREHGAVLIPSDGEDDLNESFLGTPFFSGDQVAGVISVQSYQKHAYDEGDVRLLSTLASSMSVALENARLFEETNRLLDETRQRAAELSIINNVGQALSKKLEFNAILELIGDRVREIFEADTMYIVLYNPLEELPYSTYYVDREQQIDFAPSRKVVGLAKVIVDTEKPLLFATAEEGIEMGVASVAKEGEEDLNESFIGVPFFRGGRIAGVISVQSYQQYRYDQSDMRLLTTLATSMSVALENARLFDETNRLLKDARQRNTELAAINTVSKALVAEAEIDNLIELIGEQVRTTFHADIAYVALHDTKTGMVNFPYLFGEQLESIPFGEGLTSQILQSGEPLLINRDLDGAMVDMETEVVGIQAASYLGVPITVGGHAIGVISVQSTHQEGRFSDSDVRLLSTIAANAGAAIRNAQLLAETKQRASEMAALNELGREASASLDLPTVLDRISNSAREMLDAESSAVVLLDDDNVTLRPIAAAGDIADEIMAFSWSVGQGIIGDSVQKGRAERISDAANDPRAIHIEGTAEGSAGEKIMVAPLFAREEVIGAMVVWRDKDGDIFNEDNLSFLTGLSQQAGASIHNARLFDQIQRQNQYLEALVENSPVAIMTVDLDFRVVSWNPAAEKLFGYSEQEALGQYAHDLHSKEEDILAESLDFSQQVAAGQRIQAITQRSTKDGSRVDVELMAVPVIVGGSQVGNIIIYHDISELKQAEAALLQQKEYLQAVVSNSPVAIVTADQDARIVSWNPAAETLFGYSAEEAIGQALDELIAGDDPAMREEAEDFSRQAREGLLHENTQRLCKDGTPIDVELLGVPVMVDGQQAGIIAIYHDITELKQAKEEAEAANEAKSAFLATMSHEIRTPMNAVIGMSGLLLDTELSDEQHEFAEIIRGSSDSLLAIINDILDFSKIEAGKMELEDQPFNLRDCIEGTLDLVAGRAFEKDLDLAYFIEDGTPAQIIGDITRFRQILLNLLTNAVKFTDEGEVVVTVGVEEDGASQSDGKGDGSCEIHTRVRDTGIGIPEDRMDRLFQSFSQVDASTARRYGGTGLGLAISRRLTEMMGGSMWAESEVGVGTVFHFTIQAEEAEGTVDAGASLRSEEPQLAGRRVLIVDDNDTNRRILSLQVKSWGMSPRDTHSPKQAVSWIEGNEPFDIAILDMHMPDIDGLELASSIRQLPAGEALPLILFTSLGRREAQTEEVDFAAYLSKPIKPSQLLDALIGVFADRPARMQPKDTVKGKVDPELGSKHPLRILLAEDNAVNQKLAIRLLDQMGYRADVAANGQEALDSLERQEYDVVLMDVQMPEMDGLEASRQINQRWGQQERPRIIDMTANAMQGDRERCLEAGMDDYVSKPVRVNELIEALRRVPSRPPGDG